MTECIDYSRGGIPSVTTLRDSGIVGVGRYAVRDLSPGGRGISRDEYTGRWKPAGIKVFLYYEGVARWMVGGIDPDTGQDGGPGGWDAGVAAAQDAQANLLAAGMPAGIPIHFAHDIDPDPAHFSQIDQCLSGAKSVLGDWSRIGAYGGWLLIDYLAGGGNVTKLVQTIAWEYGRGLHPAATLYQNDTSGNFFDGVDCDIVQIVKPHYGQDTDYLIATPTPTPTPIPPVKPLPNPGPKAARKASPPYGAPHLPDWWDAQKKLQFPTDQDFDGSHWSAERRKSLVLRETNQLTSASGRSGFAGENLVRDNIVFVERTMTAADGRKFAILRAGGHGKEGARVLLADLKETPEVPG